MYRQCPARTSGLVLIESLIALLVLSFGLLAVGKLQGNLIGSAGLAKARTEAAQLAHSLINSRRVAFQASPTCESDLAGLVSSGSSSITTTGTNATFTATSTYASTPHGVLMRVTVTWTDAQGQPQTVPVVSEVRCGDPRTLALAAGYGGSTSGLTLPGSKILRYPDPDDYPPLSGSGVANGDGSETRISGTKAQLINIRTGEVMLQQEGSTAGQGFSTVSGYVYIDNVEPELNKTMVLASGPTVCNRIFSNGNDFATPWGASGYPALPLAYESGGDRYFKYTCYLGEGWYGNIGVLRTDKAAMRDRLCLGDPVVTPATAWTSRHPRLSTLRDYRGFRNIGTVSVPVYTAVGIGVDVTTGSSYTAIHLGDERTADDPGHDFLLTPITGNPVDTACAVPLAGAFAGNPGKHYCFTAASTCNASQGEQAINPYDFRLTGSILPRSNNEPVILVTGAGGVTIDGFNCNVAGPDQNTKGYTYDCQVSYDGWTGDTTSALWQVYFGTKSDGEPFNGELCKDVASNTTMVSGTGEPYIGVFDMSLGTVTLINLPTIQTSLTLNFYTGVESSSNPNARCPK